MDNHCLLRFYFEVLDYILKYILNKYWENQIYRLKSYVK